MNKLVLPDSIASPQDIVAVLLEIRQYSKWIAHESIKKRVNAKHTSDAPDLSPSAQELIRTFDPKKPYTSTSFDSMIDTLEHYRSKALLITITLAAPPNNSIKATLVNWCRSQISPNVLVSFRFNATLLGGMVIQYGSRVFDWSFRRRILAERHHFPEVLRRV